MLARVSWSPSSFAHCVGVAAPEVDGEFAVDPDGDAAPDLVAIAEVGFEKASRDAARSQEAEPLTVTREWSITSLLRRGQGCLSADRMAQPVKAVQSEGKSRLRFDCDSAEMPMRRLRRTPRHNRSAFAPLPTGNDIVAPSKAHGQEHSGWHERSTKHSGVLRLGQWRIGEVWTARYGEPSNRCAAAIAEVQLERRCAVL